MEIVIKISEHNKNVIDRFVNGEGFEVLPTPIVDDVIRAVRNGKPLPKGHDRLVCVNKVFDAIQLGDFSSSDDLDEALYIVGTVPTIIEKDDE